MAGARAAVVAVARAVEAEEGLAEAEEGEVKAALPVAVHNVRTM